MDELTHERKSYILKVLDYIGSRFEMLKHEGRTFFTKRKSGVELGGYRASKEALVEMDFNDLSRFTELNKVQLQRVFNHLKEVEVISTMDISCLHEVRKSAVELYDLTKVGTSTPRAKIRLETDEKRIRKYASYIRSLGFPEEGIWITTFLGEPTGELEDQKENKANGIKSIFCVKPDQDQNKYKLVLNQDYKNILIADKAKPSWDTLFRVAQGDSLSSEEHKSSMDYLNTNTNCKLYSQTSYALTKILKSEDGYIIPAIPIIIISEKAFQQRLKKGRQAA